MLVYQIGKSTYTYVHIAYISECKIQNECIVTTDRDYLGNGNVDQFDALVIQIRFFLHDKETLEMIPKRRNSFQRYVFYTHEAPRKFKFPFYNHKILER